MRPDPKFVGPPPTCSLDMSAWVLWTLLNVRPTKDD